MEYYSLGLFSNAYPASPGDYRGQFIKRMVDLLEIRGVRVRLAVKTSPSPLRYIPFFVDSARTALDTSIDILQAHYIPHSSLIPFLLKNRRPLILKFHGNDGRIYPFQNTLNRKITQSMIRRADHMITVSQEIRERLIELGASGEAVTVLSSGVNTEVFKPIDKFEARTRLGLDIDAIFALYAGRFHPEKGIDELINLARQTQDITFLLIGSGSLPPLPTNCRVIGEVSHHEMSTYIGASDMSLLPSRTEGISNFIMESLACERPVVATSVGGTPEIVQDGSNGLLVPSGDVARLHGAVAWLAEHPEEQMRMGKKGRTEMIRLYDEERLIERLIKIHKSLLEGTVK